MKLKLAQGVSLTQEQTLEVAQVIMTEPDMGWGYDSETRSTKSGVYDVVLDGEHGQYKYRVNTSFELITLKAVK
jgi:hypothetical protein